MTETMTERIKEHIDGPSDRIKLMTHAVPEGIHSNASTWERFSGGLGAFVFTSVYLMAPFLGFVLILAYALGFVIFAKMVLLTLLASMIAPARASDVVWKTWPMKHVPKYFNATIVYETLPDEIYALRSRSAIFALSPHGTISFGGMCMLGLSPDWFSVHRLPTAAASSVMWTPLIRQVAGLCGLIKASREVLGAWLEKGNSFCLYPGGIAELFKCNGPDEVLFLRERKGFVKMALQNGSEIVPIYFFGNTQVLQAKSTRPLERLSRLIGVSLCWMVGWKGTWLPKPEKIVVVVGRPLGMPTDKNACPPRELIEHWHGIYLAEVDRLYQSYRKLHPNYIARPLRIE